MNRHIDIGSFIIALITLGLFVASLFVKGLPHDLFLETGVFLVSVKIIVMADYISLSYEEDDSAHKSERNGIVSKPDWPACRAVRAFGFQRQDAPYRRLPGGMAANGFPSAPGLIALREPSAAVAAAREGTRGQEYSRCGGYFRGRLSGPQLRGGYRTALAPPGR